ETLPRARLTLRFPDGQAWTPGEQPDVLIFPGGEVTPFQLRIDAATGITSTPRATASRWRRGSSHEA
ncbi:hypothetical protein GEO37_29080, partial [Klebsiella pneumoniae]|nr:hypothetical protein [Klebsiella pneumoniae]